MAHTPVCSLLDFVVAQIYNLLAVDEAPVDLGVPVPQDLALDAVAPPAGVVGEVAGVEAVILYKVRPRPAVRQLQLQGRVGGTRGRAVNRGSRSAWRKLLLVNFTIKNLLKTLCLIGICQVPVLIES